MRKTFLLAMLSLLSMSLMAQTGVTQFLGIPIDGSKPEMIQKLKAKGFTSSLYDRNILEGEFNGKNVNLYIVTNNNKVYRIMVADATPTDETNIKINFNNLCRQFGNNKKYIPAANSVEDFILSDDEDIDYEMLAHNKRYEAAFYQIPNLTDSIALQKEIHAFLLTKYTEDILNNPTEEQQAEIGKTTMQYLDDKITKNSVWFMISENYGKFTINIFYDNENNKANGEDL
jgi:hypothetical protein